MKNDGQPISNFLPWNSQCTKGPRWLNNVFLFSTEIWAEQLKKITLYQASLPRWVTGHKYIDNRDRIVPSVYIYPHVTNSSSLEPTHLSPLSSEASHLSTFLSTQKNGMNLKSTFFSGFTLLSAQKSTQGLISKVEEDSATGLHESRVAGSRNWVRVKKSKMRDVSQTAWAAS